MIGIQNYYSCSCQNLILKKLSVPKCRFRHLAAAFNRNCFVYIIPTGPKDIQLNGRNYDSNPERLQTFLDWPPNHPVLAINLAQNGFVYSGGSLQAAAGEDNENDDDDDDEVICPFCFEIKSGWSLEDNPREVHGPTCPFQLNSSAGGTYLDVFQSNTPLLSNHSRRGRNSGNIRSIRAPVHHRRSLRRDNNLAQHRLTQMWQQPPQHDDLPAQHSQLQRWRQPPQPDNTRNPLRIYWPFIFHLSSTRHVTTWYWTSDSCLFRSADSIERLVCAIPRWNYSSLDYSTTSQQTSIWQYQISILDFSARGTTTHHGINLMEGGFIQYVQNFWNYSRIVLYAVNFWIQGLFNYSSSGSHILRLSRCLSYASLAIQLSRSTPRPFFTLLQTSSSTEMMINQPRQHYPSYFIGGRIRRPMIRKILLLRCDGVVFLMSTDSTRNIYRNN